MFWEQRPPEGVWQLQLSTFLKVKAVVTCLQLGRRVTLFRLFTLWDIRCQRSLICRANSPANDVYMQNKSFITSAGMTAASLRPWRLSAPPYTSCQKISQAKKQVEELVCCVITQTAGGLGCRFFLFHKIRRLGADLWLYSHLSSQSPISVGMELLSWVRLGKGEWDGICCSFHNWREILFDMILWRPDRLSDF